MGNGAHSVRREQRLLRRYRSEESARGRKIAARIHQGQVWPARRSHREQQGLVEGRRSSAARSCEGLEEKRRVLRPATTDVRTAMPSSKEIRVKIKSVQNTRKITKAMEMVAASRCARRRIACAMRGPTATRYAISPRIWHTRIRNIAIRFW